MRITKNQLKRLIREEKRKLLEQDMPASSRMKVGTMVVPADEDAEWVVVPEEFNGMMMVIPEMAGDSAGVGSFDGKPLMYVGRQRASPDPAGGSLASSPGYASDSAYILEDPDSGERYWISGDWLRSLWTV